MNRNRGRLPLRVMLGLGAVLPMVTVGCVSTDLYETAKREAQQTQAQLHKEQGRAQALELQNKDLAQRMDKMEKWVDKLWHTSERLEGLGKDLDELRDELVRLRIDRELQRQKGRSQSPMGGIRLEPEPDRPEAEPAAKIKPQVSSEEAKQRLRDLMQQLKTILEQQ